MATANAEALTKAVEAAALPLAQRSAIPVTADAVERLAQHAEQRLLLVIEEASKFMTNCKRQEMAPVDVTHSLHMHRDPPVLGIGASSTTVLTPVHTAGGVTTSMLDDGVSHAFQAAKRPREVQPLGSVPDEVFRHWFVMAGVPVASRFNPPDSFVLEADSEEKRLRSEAGVQRAPGSALSAEYTAAADGIAAAAGSGVAAGQDVSALLGVLTPKQLHFLQRVGAALAAAAGGHAPWLPAWGAPAAMAPPTGSWGAFSTGSGTSAPWYGACRAAVGAMEAITDFSVVLGPVATMLSDSASHAGRNPALAQCVVAVISAMARSPSLPLDQQLHRLLPALLTAALGPAGQDMPAAAAEAFEAREAAAKALGIVADRYGHVYPTLRPRLESLLAKPLTALVEAGTGSAGEQGEGAAPSGAQGTTTVRLGEGGAVAQSVEVPQAPPLPVVYGAIVCAAALGRPTARAVVQPAAAAVETAMAAAAASGAQAEPLAKGMADHEVAMVRYALSAAQALVDGSAPSVLARPQAPAVPVLPLLPQALPEPAAAPAPLAPAQPAVVPPPPDVPATDAIVPEAEEEGVAPAPAVEASAPPSVPIVAEEPGEGEDEFEL